MQRSAVLVLLLALAGLALAFAVPVKESSPGSLAAASPKSLTAIPTAHHDKRFMQTKGPLLGDMTIDDATRDDIRTVLLFLTDLDAETVDKRIFKAKFEIPWYFVLGTCLSLLSDPQSMKAIEKAANIPSAKNGQWKEHAQFGPVAKFWIKHAAAIIKPWVASKKQINHKCGTFFGPDCAPAETIYLKARPLRGVATNCAAGPNTLHGCDGQMSDRLHVFKECLKKEEPGYTLNYKYYTVAPVGDCKKESFFSSTCGTDDQCFADMSKNGCKGQCVCSRIGQTMNKCQCLMGIHPDFCKFFSLRHTDEW